jgi:hypothetical protein
VSQNIQDCIEPLVSFQSRELLYVSFHYKKMTWK